MRDIVAPDDKHIWDGHRHDVQSDEHVLREVQFRIMKKDGSTIWIEHSCQPVEDADGGFLGFRGVGMLAVCVCLGFSQSVPKNLVRLLSDGHRFCHSC